MTPLVSLGTAMASEPASAFAVLVLLFVIAYGFVLWAMGRPKRDHPAG
jgi:hypothetical protein